MAPLQELGARVLKRRRRKRKKTMRMWIRTANRLKRHLRLGCSSSSSNSKQLPACNNHSLNPACTHLLAVFPLQRIRLHTRIADLPVRCLSLQPVLVQVRVMPLSGAHLCLPFIVCLGPDDFAGPQMRMRTSSEHHVESGRRTYFDEAAQPQPRSHLQAPGAARQNVWSQVLDAGAGAGFVSPNEPTQNTKDTFVQLEPNEKMTKAFTPQGLLSAGMQDKQDRSAKRQEELARETGASLINVPNKPPPPQTGLLGAITSHERERKREGGLGAALTEREREKRVAEERQRRFDEQQRQQLDQMQQGGSMYGAPYGFNPMMNPMMMGMNPMMGMPPMAPMMTGGNMMPGQAPLAPMMTGGMNPMMTGGGMNPMMGYGMFNPQHMFAAQQAAQAYQNAMIAFSVAGSQVGGDGTGGQGPGPQNQGMMGGNMSTMGGFDPRMSMNLMGMQGMMGGMPMMNPGPLNAQNTGMSQFDPRFGTPGVNGGPSADSGNLTPPNALQNLSAPGSQLGSGHNSPIVRGSSPLRQSSRPASPK